jgi:hypothetical protein
MLCGSVNASRPRANRRTRTAPTTASAVLPAAIPSEVAMAPATVTLTMKAPRKIAGHGRRPTMSRAASAHPVGGQMGVALGCRDATDSPVIPSTTYPTSTTANGTARDSGR